MIYETTLRSFTLPVYKKDMNKALRVMNLLYVILDSEASNVIKNNIIALGKVDKPKGSMRYKVAASQVLNIAPVCTRTEDVEYILPILSRYFTNTNNNFCYGYFFDRLGNISETYSRTHFVWEELVKIVAYISSPGLSAEIIFENNDKDIYGGIAGKDKSGRPYVRWVKRMDIVYSDEEYVTDYERDISWQNS